MTLHRDDMAASTGLTSLTDAEVIGLWKQSKGGPDPTDDIGNIGSLFESCLQMLKLLLRASSKVETAQPFCKSVESSLATLFFWDEEFGESRGDVDRAFEQSEDTYNLTLSIFLSLGDFLSHGNTPF